MVQNDDFSTVFHSVSSHQPEKRFKAKTFCMAASFHWFEIFEYSISFWNIFFSISPKFSLTDLELVESLGPPVLLKFCLFEQCWSSCWVQQSRQQYCWNVKSCLCRWTDSCCWDTVQTCANTNRWRPFGDMYQGNWFSLSHSPSACSARSQWSLKELGLWLAWPFVSRHTAAHTKVPLEKKNRQHWFLSSITGGPFRGSAECLLKPQLKCTAHQCVAVLNLGLPTSHLISLHLTSERANVRVFKFIGKHIHARTQTHTVYVCRGWPSQSLL